jgi:hypothetical protein
MEYRAKKITGSGELRWSILVFGLLGCLVLEAGDR